MLTYALDLSARIAAKRTRCVALGAATLLAVCALAGRAVADVPVGAAQPVTATAEVAAGTALTSAASTATASAVATAQPAQALPAPAAQTGQSSGATTTTTTTTAAVSSAGAPAGEVVPTGAGGAKPVVSSLTHAVGPVVSSGTKLVASSAAPVIKTVTRNATTVTAPVTHAVLSTARESVVAPVLKTATRVAGGATAPIVARATQGTASLVASAQEPARRTTGGTLQLPSGPTPKAPGPVAHDPGHGSQARDQHSASAGAGAAVGVAGTAMHTLRAERTGGLAARVWPPQSLAGALGARRGALQTSLAGLSLRPWEPPSPGMHAMSRRSAEDGVAAPAPTPGGVGPPAAAASGVGASSLLLLSALLLLATPALLRRLRVLSELSPMSPCIAISAPPG
jgi:hypothetical protein